MSRNHALFDVETNRLLATATSPAVIVFLSEAIVNSYSVYSIKGEVFDSLAETPPDDYPSWRWNKGANGSLTRIESATDILSARSRLAVAKARAIGKIISSISYMRASVGTGIIFQESVYLSKRLEAERLRAQGFATDNPTDFPYVVQYADYARLPLKEAAERILEQTKLDDHLLARTEIFRIRYFDKVRAASTPEETAAVLEDYVRESYLNGLI